MSSHHLTHSSTQTDENGENDDFTGEGANTIGGGNGNDTFDISSSNSQDISSLTGGNGVDIYILEASNAGSLIVTDFVAGAGGDIIDVSHLITASSGYGAVSGSLNTNYFQLVSSMETNTLLQWDSDGIATSSGWQTVLTLDNVTPANLNSSNFILQQPLQTPGMPVLVTGDSNSDGIINAAEAAATIQIQSSLSGTGVIVGDTVELFNGLTSLSKVTLTSNDITAGKATFNLVAGALGTGESSLTLTAVATNTRGSATSSTLTLSLDTVVATPVLTFATDTITVTGLETGATWQYSLDNGENFTTGSVNSFVLANGEYGTGIVKVKQTDLAGNVSSFGTNETALSVVTPVVNNAPTGSATAILATGTEDTACTINANDLLTGFSDSDVNDVLSVSNLAATNGELTNNEDGTWTFTPTANYNGTVNLTYDVTDGHGGSIAATQSFVLAAVNDLPSGSVTISGSTTQGQTLTASNTLNDIDRLGTISYQWQKSSDNTAWNNITLTTDSTFLPLTSGEANKYIRVIASYIDLDGTSESVTSSTTEIITAINNAPTGSATATLATGTEDTTYSINANDLLTGFSDSDVNDVLSVSNLAATNGELVNNSDGTWTFTPTANYNGIVNLTYDVTDGHDGSIAATQSFVLNAVNDAPTATNLNASENYIQNTPLDLTDIVVSDVDSSSVTVTLTLSNSAAGSLNTATSNAITSAYDVETGIWTATGDIADINTLLAGLTFTPTSDFNSDFTITTRISDGVATTITGSKNFTGTPSLDSNNLGFENNFTGWTTNDATISTANHVINAGGKTWTINPHNTNMAFLSPNGYSNERASVYAALAVDSTSQDYLNTQFTNPTNYSYVYTDITLAANQEFSMAWNYVTTDYAPWNDGSWTSFVNTSNAADSSMQIKVGTYPYVTGSAAILGATVLGTGSYVTGDYGSTGWQTVSLKAGEAGTYRLGFSVFNLGDTAVPSYLFVDQISGTTLLNGNPFGAVLPPTTGLAPTFTAFSDVVTSGNEDTEIEVSFANLQEKGNETDTYGTVPEFVVKTVTTGTLKIGESSNSATAFAVGTNDIIDATHKAYWTPAANYNGTLNAFTVVAKNNSGGVSTTPVQATLNVQPVNDAPTLNPTVITYTDTALKDTFATTANTLSTTDIDSNSFTFNIDGGSENNTTVSKIGTYGTLTVIKATGAYSFVPNDAVIEPLTTDVSESFTIVVSDGELTDSELFTVNITQSGITESTGNDSLTGTIGDDVISGLAGNDTIDGLAGVDTMIGSSGNDVYIVDNSADKIIETSNSGYDSVESTATYTLPNYVENLTLTGNGDIDATGNNTTNILTGNSGNNRLDGRSGADTLAGGLGNDTYIVDNKKDVVQENLNGGSDLVSSTVDYTLPSNVENLILMGRSTIVGIGNSENNIITGNSGNNTLRGLIGDDYLSGGAGNDVLIGGDGVDSLTGGLGMDKFKFENITDSLVGTPDVIADFNSTQKDKIDLSLIDASTTVYGNNAFTLTSSNGTDAFSNLSGQLRYSLLDGNAIIEGDVDGDGTADFQIQVTGVTSLQASNFVL